MTVISARVGSSAKSRLAAPSFETFFHAEYDNVVRAVTVFARDAPEAEDLVQEAMVRAYLRWPRVSQFASPAGYAYRTAVNLHRSRIRRLTAWRRLSSPAQSPSGAGTAERAIARTDLVQALGRLPADQRDALMLVEWFGLSSAEAGQLLGIAAGSVRSRLARARAVLAAGLSDHVPGGDDARA